MLAYLLTGDERWLRDTFDAAASFASLLDFDTGELRWAFVVDPKVHARQISEPVPGLTADPATSHKAMPCSCSIRHRAS